MSGWDAIEALALALPQTEAASHYRKPAVKAAGRAFVVASDDPGSFVLLIDRETKAILLETDPETFWQTPHYEGWPSLLVRYDSADPERVAAMVERAHAQALAFGPPRSRRKPKG